AGTFADSAGALAWAARGHTHRPGPRRGRHCQSLSPIVPDCPSLALLLDAGSLPVGCPLDVASPHLRGSRTIFGSRPQSAPAQERRGGATAPCRRAAALGEQFG